jgi:HlyD family secretion protein
MRLRFSPVFFLVLVVAVAAGVVWRLRPQTPSSPTWQGYVDADYVKVGPTLAGALTSVPVQRGQTVVRGRLLFQQDDGDERGALDQAVKQLAQAEQALANLEAAEKPTQIEQARANLVDLSAARDQAEADLKRGQTLLPHGAASVQNVDQLRASYDSASAKVLGAQAALSQSLEPLGRPREITGQEAAVQADRAAVAMAKWRLDQRRVFAPIGGTIDDVLALAGETLQAGAPVVSILAPENMLVRFFAPESELALVHMGDRVRLACDNCPSDFTATVSYVAPQAEYTPPVIYSEASRQKFVYRIEARPPVDRGMLLHPGEPVDVSLIQDSGGAR